MVRRRFGEEQLFERFDRTRTRATIGTLPFRPATADEENSEDNGPDHQHPETDFNR